MLNFNFSTLKGLHLVWGCIVWAFSHKNPLRGLTCRSVEENRYMDSYKNFCLRVISPVYREALLGQIYIKFYMSGHLADIINRAKFYFNQIRGFWFCGGRIFGFPIGKRNRRWHMAWTIVQPVIWQCTGAGVEPATSAFGYHYTCDWHMFAASSDDISSADVASLLREAIQIGQSPSKWQLLPELCIIHWSWNCFALWYCVTLLMWCILVQFYSDRFVLIMVLHCRVLSSINLNSCIIIALLVSVACFKGLVCYGFSRSW